MAEKTVRILQQQTKPITLIKWRVQPGATVSIGRPLLVYKFADGQQKPEQRKLKSAHAGTVNKMHAKEGDRIDPGELLMELEACCHPTIMNDMCAECGADLRKDDAVSIASVPMIHAIPDLKVSEELAQKLGRADNERLIRDRKLVLLVDLDQTLIHTTNDNIPPNIRNVYHFQLYGPNSPWYHTRLRPDTHRFLNNIYDYYELHICTFGARNYAHMIALFLDANQKIFSNRILSRDECFDPTSKKANLKALFPCGDNMVCIIDDREDVWSHASNLIHVKPYHFFQHTGDINAPPGLDKYELEGAGVDLSKAAEAMRGDEVDESKNDDDDKREIDGKGEGRTDDELKDNVDEIDRDEKEKEEIASGKSEELEMKEESTPEQAGIQEETNQTNVNGDDDEVMIIDTQTSIKVDIKKTDVNVDDDEVVIIDTHTSINEDIKKTDVNVDDDEVMIIDTQVGIKEDIKKTDVNVDDDEVVIIDTHTSIKEDIKKTDVNVDDDEVMIIDTQTSIKEDIKKTDVDDDEVMTIDTQVGIKEDIMKTDANVDDDEVVIIEDDEVMVMKDDKGVIDEDEVNKPSLELPNNGEELNKPKPKIKENPVEPKDNKIEKQTAPSDQNPEIHMIDVEDADDYLIYLEDILKRIHKEFYNQFDKMESGDIPDLKQVIPRVRSSVLKGCNMAFSGLVPTHVKLNQSKAYQVARSLGAKITQDIEEDTTHLVAVRPGTAKVNAGRRKKNLKIVTPDWLWCCAERWEHADERVFPLKAKGSKNRHPPPHCSSPERIPTYPVHNTPMSRKRTPSGRFMDTINPLMSFSSADIADMDKEVEDILDNDTDSSEEEPSSPPEVDVETPKIPEINDLDSSDSNSSSERYPLEEEEDPPGRGTKRKWEQDMDDRLESSDDETPGVRFRRGENVDDVVDLEGQESEGSIDPPDEVDDGEWNMMGAALEREFLANN